MRHNDVNNMIPTAPIICVTSRFSTKLIVFKKMFQTSLTAKQVEPMFEEPLNFHIFVG